MQFEPELFYFGGDGFEFVGRVDGADFSGVGNADGAGFWKMDVGAAGDGAFDGCGIDFAVVAGEKEDLHAVGEKLGRAAFVGFDMGEFMAEDAVIGLAEGGQGQGVRGGAVEDEEDFALSFENFAQGVGGFGGPLVIAVTDGVAGVGFGESGPGFRADAGVVVAGEVAEAW